MQILNFQYMLSKNQTPTISKVHQKVVNQRIKKYKNHIGKLIDWEKAKKC